MFREDEKRDQKKADEILHYLEQDIVVDTTSHFLFIGKFLDVGDYFIKLGDADVHDNKESTSTKEKYILESKKFGVKTNRKVVHIRLDEVISISSLEDVIEY